MDLLKKNWLTIVLALVSVISGADVAAGLSQGKALLNLTNIPAIGLGGCIVGDDLPAVVQRACCHYPCDSSGVGCRDDAASGITVRGCQSSGRDS